MIQYLERSWHVFFEQWVEKVQHILDEMKQNGEIASKLTTLNKARAMIATIEGGDFINEK